MGKKSLLKKLGGKKFNFWNYLVLFLVILTGLLYYITNHVRTLEGYYTSDIIFWDNFTYVVFYALLSGFVITFMLSKTTVGNGNNGK